MKILSGLLVFFVLICLFNSASGQENGKLYFNDKNSKALVKKALKKGHRFFLTSPITSPEAAITLVEPLLFKVYGKKNIISQKPYHIYSNDLNWFIYGDLPEGYMGGTFNVIINKETGEVIKLIHGQ